MVAITRDCTRWTIDHYLPLKLVTTVDSLLDFWEQEEGSWEEQTATASDRVRQDRKVWAYTQLGISPGRGFASDVRKSDWIADMPSLGSLWFFCLNKGRIL